MSSNLPTARVGVAHHPFVELSRYAAVAVSFGIRLTDAPVHPTVPGIRTCPPMDKSKTTDSTKTSPSKIHRSPAPGRRHRNPVDYDHPYPSMREFAILLNLRYSGNRTRHAYYRAMRLVHEFLGKDSRWPPRASSGTTSPSSPTTRAGGQRPSVRPPRRRSSSTWRC